MYRISKFQIKTAFTLIELLVVIAIISLLVSILLPSLNRAKELAKRTICGTNLHNIAMACQMYNHDSDGYVPPNQLLAADGSVAFSRHPWPYVTDAYLDAEGKYISGIGHILLMPYLNGEADMHGTPGTAGGTYEVAFGAWKIFSCPSSEEFSSLTRGYPHGGAYAVGTAYNQFCGYKFADGDTEWIPDSSYRMDDLAPRFPMYADYTFGWTGNPYLAAGWNHDSSAFAGLNTARADGSVDWISRDNPNEDIIPLPASQEQLRCYWMPASR